MPNANRTSMLVRHVLQVVFSLACVLVSLSTASSHAQERPERGKIIYEGTYSGRAAEGFLFLGGSNIEGAITITLDFNGSAVRATYRATGGLPSGSVSGLLKGDVCKLQGSRNLTIEGECTGTAFNGTLVSQPVPERKTTVTFQLVGRPDSAETASRRNSIAAAGKTAPPVQAQMPMKSVERPADQSTLMSPPGAQSGQREQPTAAGDAGLSGPSTRASSSQSGASALGVDVLRVGMTLEQVDAAVVGSGLTRMRMDDSSRQYSLKDNDTKNEIQVGLSFSRGKLAAVSLSVLGAELEPGAQDKLWRQRVTTLYGRPVTSEFGGKGQNTYCHGPDFGVELPTQPPSKGAFLGYYTDAYENVRRCRGSRLAPAFDPIAYSRQPASVGSIAVASTYGEGAGDPPHPQEANAMAGNIEAQWQVGATYVMYKFSPEKQRQGVQLLESAAAKGDVRAMNKLGQFFAQIAAPPDFNLAMKWFVRAEAAGDPFAAYNIAGLYERGEGVSMDKAAALRWYIKAASIGDPDAAAKVLSLDNSFYTRKFDAIPASVKRDAEELRFVKGTDLRDYLDALLYFQAEDWRVNKYDRGTLRNVKVTAGDVNGVKFTARANYGYTNGGSRSAPADLYVDVTVANGKVECIQYGDDRSGRCWVIPRIFVQPQTTQPQRQACFREERSPRYQTAERTVCTKFVAGSTGLCQAESVETERVYAGEDVTLTNSCSFPIVVEPRDVSERRRSEGRQTLAPRGRLTLSNAPPMRVP